MQRQELISNNVILGFVGFRERNNCDRRNKEARDIWRKKDKDTAQEQYTWQGNLFRRSI